MDTVTLNSVALISSVYQSWDKTPLSVRAYLIQRCITYNPETNQARCVCGNKSIYHWSIHNTMATRCFVIRNKDEPLNPNEVKISCSP